MEVYTVYISNKHSLFFRVYITKLKENSKFMFQHLKHVNI